MSVTGRRRAGSHDGDDLSVDIRALTPDKLSAATAILADGMLENPLHLRVFGVDSDHRHQRLLRFLGPLIVYAHANGEMLGAYVQRELIGVLGMIKPGRCRPELNDRLRFARALLTSAPPTTLLRILRWLAAWARNDLNVSHWGILAR